MSDLWASQSCGVFLLKFDQRAEVARSGEGNFVTVIHRLQHLFLISIDGGNARPVISTDRDESTYQLQ